jgi:hypothetical protein
LAYYPETANRLLVEIAMVEDVLTCLKARAVKLKQQLVDSHEPACTDEQGD